MGNDIKKMVLHRTSDIYFSAYLMCMGMSLIDLEEGKNDRGQPKKIFVFQVPQREVRRLKALYHGGTGTVKCRKFVDDLKNLKSMLYT